MSLVGGFKKPTAGVYEVRGASVKPMMRPDCPRCMHGEGSQNYGQTPPYHSHNHDQTAPGQEYRLGNPHHSHNYAQTAPGQEHRMENSFAKLQQGGYNVASGISNSPFASSGNSFGGHSGQFAQSNGLYGMPPHCIYTPLNQRP